MALSLVAEEILTEHRSSLAKAMKTPGKRQPQNFGKELQHRMIGELWSHAERAGTSHRYRWERLHQHGTPEDLAAFIEEARRYADAKEKKDPGRDDVDNEEFGQTDTTGTSLDVNSQETKLGIARLLGHYRGQPIGIEAKHPDGDDHAMTTPDPDDTGGAQVVVYGQNGIKAISSHPDPRAALAHMVAAGYTEPAPGSYAEHSESPRWHRLHKWAKRTSSGDQTADVDRSAQHRDELTAAINNWTAPLSCVVTTEVVL